MRRIRANGRLLPAIGVATVVLIVAGCGGDDDQGTGPDPATIEQPAPQAPGPEAEGPGGPEQPQAEPEPGGRYSPGQREPGSGEQGSGGSGPGRVQPDRDPPPPGSPQERFEEFCDRNPEACG